MRSRRLSVVFFAYLLAVVLFASTYSFLRDPYNTIEQPRPVHTGAWSVNPPPVLLSNDTFLGSQLPFKLFALDGSAAPAGVPVVLTITSAVVRARGVASDASAQVLTDSAGTVRFPDIPAQSLPPTSVLTVSVDRSFAPTFQPVRSSVRILSIVHSVRALSAAGTLRADLGQPLLGFPTFLVASATGAPIPSVLCSAQPAPGARTANSFSLQGNVALTKSNGVATFSDLSISGGVGGVAVVSVVCSGVQSPSTVLVELLDTTSMSSIDLFLSASSRATATPTNRLLLSGSDLSFTARAETKRNASNGIVAPVSQKAVSLQLVSWHGMPSSVCSSLGDTSDITDTTGEHRLQDLAAGWSQFCTLARPDVGSTLELCDAQGIARFELSLGPLLDVPPVGRGNLNLRVRAASIVSSSDTQVFSGEFDIVVPNPARHVSLISTRLVVGNATVGAGGAPLESALEVTPGGELALSPPPLLSISGLNVSAEMPLVAFIASYTPASGGGGASGFVALQGVGSPAQLTQSKNALFHFDISALSFATAVPGSYEIGFCIPRFGFSPSRDVLRTSEVSGRARSATPCAGAAEGVQQPPIPTLTVQVTDSQLVAAEAATSNAQACSAVHVDWEVLVAPTATPFEVIGGMSTRLNATVLGFNGSTMPGHVLRWSVVSLDAQTVHFVSDEAAADASGSAELSLHLVHFQTDVTVAVQVLAYPAAQSSNFSSSLATCFSSRQVVILRQNIQRVEVTTPVSGSPEQPFTVQPNGHISAPAAVVMVHLSSAGVGSASVDVVAVPALCPVPSKHPGPQPCPGPTLLSADTGANRCGCAQRLMQASVPSGASQTISTPFGQLSLFQRPAGLYAFDILVGGILTKQRLWARVPAIVASVSAAGTATFNTPLVAPNGGPLLLVGAASQSVSPAALLVQPDGAPFATTANASVQLLCIAAPANSTLERALSSPGISSRPCTLGAAGTGAAGEGAVPGCDARPAAPITGAVNASGHVSFPTVFVAAAPSCSEFGQPAASTPVTSAASILGATALCNGVLQFFLVAAPPNDGGSLSFEPVVLGSGSVFQLVRFLYVSNALPSPLTVGGAFDNTALAQPVSVSVIYVNVQPSTAYLPFSQFESQARALASCTSVFSSYPTGHTPATLTAAGDGRQDVPSQPLIAAVRPFSNVLGTLVLRPGEGSRGGQDRVLPQDSCTGISQEARIQFSVDGVTSPATTTLVAHGAVQLQVVGGVIAAAPRLGESWSESTVLTLLDAVGNPVACAAVTLSARLLEARLPTGVPSPITGEQAINALLGLDPAALVTAAKPDAVSGASGQLVNQYNMNAAVQGLYEVSVTDSASGAQLLAFQSEFSAWSVDTSVATDCNGGTDLVNMGQALCAIAFNVDVAEALAAGSAPSVFAVAVLETQGANVDSIEDPVLSGNVQGFAASGQAAFTNLRFIAGSSGTYNVYYMAGGRVLGSSKVLLLGIEADSGVLNDPTLLAVIIALIVLVLLPVLLGNSVSCCLCCTRFMAVYTCIVLGISAFASYVVLTERVGLTQDHVDPFQGCLAALLVSTALALFLSSVSVCMKSGFQLQTSTSVLLASIKQSTACRILCRNQQPHGTGQPSEEHIELMLGAASSQKPRDFHAGELHAGGPATSTGAGAGGVPTQTGTKMTRGSQLSRLYFRKLIALAPSNHAALQPQGGDQQWHTAGQSTVTALVFAAAGMPDPQDAMVYPFDPWGVPRDPVHGIPLVSSQQLLQFAPHVPLYTSRLFHATVYVRQRLVVGSQRHASSQAYINQFADATLALSGRTTDAPETVDEDSVRFREFLSRVLECKVCCSSRKDGGEPSTPDTCSSFCGVVQRMLQKRCSHVRASVGGAVAAKCASLRSSRVQLREVFLPLRLLIGITLSTVILLFLGLVSVFLVRNALFLVDSLHDSWVDTLDRQETLRSQQELVLQTHLSALASTNITQALQLPSDIALGLATYSAFEQASLSEFAAVTSAAIFVPALTSKSALGNLRDTIKLGLEVSGYTAAAAGLLGVLVLLYAMVQRYEVQMRALRLGQYNLLPRKKLTAASATKWIPLQLWHTVFGYLSLFVVVGIIVLVFAALFVEDAWLYRFLNINSVIVSLFSFSLISSTLTTLLLTYVLSRNTTIKHRSAFNACDFLSLVWQLGAGLLPVLTRFTISLALTFLLFVRTDLSEVAEPLSFLDTAFKSYTGMQIVDHTHNNPILIVLCELLWMDVHWARAVKRSELAQPAAPARYGGLSPPERADTGTSASAMPASQNPAPSSMRASGITATGEEESQSGLVRARKRVLQRAKAKVWLAITLHNNPQLIALRLQSRQQAAAATATTDPAHCLKLPPTKTAIRAAADAKCQQLKHAEAALLSGVLLAVPSTPSQQSAASPSKPHRQHFLDSAV